MQSPGHWLSIFVAAFFFVVVGASVVAAGIPAFVLAIYLGVSLLTFIRYAVDKSAARKGAWRVRLAVQKNGRCRRSVS